MTVQQVQQSFPHLAGFYALAPPRSITILVSLAWVIRPLTTYLLYLLLLLIYPTIGTLVTFELVKLRLHCDTVILLDLINIVTTIA